VGEPRLAEYLGKPRPASIEKRFRISDFARRIPPLDLRPYAGSRTL
jgi:hypothetical protein